MSNCWAIVFTRLEMLKVTFDNLFMFYIIQDITMKSVHHEIYHYQVYLKIHYRKALIKKEIMLGLSCKLGFWIAKTNRGSQLKKVFLVNRKQMGTVSLNITQVIPCLFSLPDNKSNSKHLCPICSWILNQLVCCFWAPLFTLGCDLAIVIDMRWSTHTICTSLCYYNTNPSWDICYFETL